MIYEIPTYKGKVGSVPEVEKRYGEAYEYRKKYSPLTAFFHTEVGPLNEIIHIWGYKDLAERARIRAEAAKDDHWPPKIQEFIVNMQSEIVVPFPFTAELLPGKIGPIFEVRYYSVRAGTMPDIIKRWEGAIGARTKLSPLALAGHVEFARPIATTTSGRTRAWSTARRSGTRRARRASGPRRAAATAS